MDSLVHARETTRRLSPIILVALIAVVVLFVLVPPFSLEEKAKSVAYGICHQIPSRSFFLAGHQLPLCARNTGIFLGAFLTFAGLYFTGRGRRVRLPSRRVMVVLGLFTVVMGVDGVNSYLDFFPSVPQLYEPSNFLRLVTGSFNGITMGMIMFPVFNTLVWRDNIDKPIVENLKELGLFVAMIVVLIAVVYAQLDFLYYPIALLSVAAVLVMVTMVNSTLVHLILRWENSSRNWRDAASPLLIAMVASLIELALLGYVRAQLTAALNLPF